MHLFSPLTIRGVTFRNRVGVSPMCQYSSEDGFANDWHLVHLGSRAVGGAGLVFVEATAVEAKGRITPRDMGLWTDAHAEPLARVAHAIAAQGAVPGIQLAHAGRKASTSAPWEGGGALSPEAGGWAPVAPSALPFSPESPTPEALSTTELARLVEAFVAAGRRALEAGFRVLELHAAHGYLLHSFLSPLSNQRTDGYGGSFAHRARLLLEVTEAVRGLSADAPLFVRLSATDWAEGGWTLEDSVAVARTLKQLGVDVVDCSSGGLVPKVRIPVAPGYQVPFAERIRREADVKTAAVGLIREPEQAEAIIAEGKADLVLLARALLRDPYWPLHAAKALGQQVSWPVQYERARD